MAIVRKLDHILVRVDDVRAAFAFFTEALALPVAWPLFPYQGFLSGAVNLAAVNLELLEPLRGNTVAAAIAPGARIVGLAFEPPAIDSAVAELDAAGLQHEPPWEFRLSDAVSWTSVPLSGTPACPIQLLVKYNRDQDARWTEFESAFTANGGGPLGLTGLAGVTIGDLASAGRWQRLLGAPEAADSWAFYRGPSLHLGERPALRLRVASIASARAGLGRLGCSFAGSGGRLSVQVWHGQEVDVLLQE